MDKKYYFDASDAGFYVFPDSTYIPDGVTEISFEDYSIFAGVAWPEGKILGADSSGMPMWIDAPPLTHEEAIAAADAQKQALIDQANDYMNSKQWPGKAAIGRLKGDELAQYNSWLDYLDALEAIDTSTAPDIEWPQVPQST
ncbi:tail fiber assembly protein [Enterobacter ludwigii]|uniref:tail fiber assembly protein n=1 Tax=Enterobacter ludwigii TaxID=299767 RepID=UPI002FD4040A